MYFTGAHLESTFRLQHICSPSCSTTLHKHVIFQLWNMEMLAISLIKHCSLHLKYQISTRSIISIFRSTHESALCRCPWFFSYFTYTWRFSFLPELRCYRQHCHEHLAFDDFFFPLWRHFPRSRKWDWIHVPLNSLSELKLAALTLTTAVLMAEWYLQRLSSQHLCISPVLRTHLSFHF